MVGGTTQSEASDWLLCLVRRRAGRSSNGHWLVIIFYSHVGGIVAGSHVLNLDVTQVEMTFVNGKMNEPKAPRST